MYQRSSLFAAAAAVLIFGVSSSANAAACRDAQGHFAACPAPVAKAKAAPCRSATGAFTSCTASTTVAKAPAMPAKSPRSRAAPAPTFAPAATGAGVNTSAVALGAVSARCKDGTLSHSLHRSGSCSGHGGVAAWM